MIMDWWLPSISTESSGLRGPALILLSGGLETDTHLPAHVENAMFRIVQESLTNVVKHAKASQVIITFGVTQGKVYLSVEDNGIGYDMSRLTGDKGERGWGLVTMSERALASRGDMPCPVPAWIRDPCTCGGTDMSVTVFLAEDHRMVREGFRLLIETQSDIKVVGEAGNWKGDGATGHKAGP